MADGRQRLHGYSERGVVNAVFNALVDEERQDHDRATALLQDLLDRLVRWENGQSVCRDSRCGGRVVDFDIYIEPSLSDFGDPDAVVFVLFRDGDGSERWETCFVEAKMEPFLMSSPPTEEELAVGSPARGGHWWDTHRPPDYQELIGLLTGCDVSTLLSNSSLEQVWRSLVGRKLPEKTDYQANASTVIHELFLKHRFWETHVQGAAGGSSFPDLASGARAYAGPEPDRLRKVGSDAVVLRLVRRLLEQGRHPLFVSLTTDPPPGRDLAEGGQWPLGMTVAHRQATMSKWNGEPRSLGWTPGNPHGSWHETSWLLSWLEVMDWAEYHELKTVMQTLDENAEKFTFWPTVACESTGPKGRYEYSSRYQPLLDFLHRRDGQARWTGRGRTHPWRASICRDDMPVLRVEPVVGFTKGYWLQVISDQKAALKALLSRGLPSRFWVEADPVWGIRGATEGSRCLEIVADALRTAHAT